MDIINKYVTPWSLIYIASVAQLVEQRIRNAWVVGSSPIGSFKGESMAEEIKFSCSGG